MEYVSGKAGMHMSKLLMFGSEVDVESQDGEEIDSFYPETEPDVCEPIDAMSLEDRFLDHCLRHGWVTVEHIEGSDHFFLTRDGKKELAKFGLTRLT